MHISMNARTKFSYLNRARVQGAQWVGIHFKNVEQCFTEDLYRSMRHPRWLKEYIQPLFAFICGLSMWFIITTVFAHSLEKNMANKLIENMTWAEVAAAQKKNKVIIIPLGAAAKEHGLHLPLNNDYIMANYLRDRILSKLDHALALPTINYNYYPAFLEYPGSTSLTLQASKALVSDICRSLAKQGFNKFYVLNTGFSTIQALEIAKQQLLKENISMEYLAPNIFFDSPLIKKIQQQERGSHADEIETSMMLYIAPHIVRMKKMARDDNPKVTPGPFTRDSPNDKGLYSPTGAWGDPTLATQEKGKVITEAYVDFILKHINDFILH
jgi:creatinine amidohydrolase